jgi:SAM-dependent methyltransferase
MSISNSTTNRYGSLAAEIYDLDKPPGKLRDTAFYLERLAGVAGEILEPACGSGRVLVDLLEAGHRAAGFDLSPDMLRRCCELCASRGFAPDLSLQAYETFAYARQFEAIIVPVGSFTLLADAAAALGTLRRFREHLVPGGLLLVDLMPLASLASRLDDRRKWIAENGDLLTIEGIVTKTDWSAQMLERTYRYERWRNNSLVESQIDPMAQRFWGRLEFQLALEAEGFSVDAVYADYRAGAEPGPETRWLTFEAHAV